MLARSCIGAVVALLVFGIPVARAQRVEARVQISPASYLGVGVMDLGEEAGREIGLVDPHGIEITSVQSGSPAERAGLQRGDIVLTFRDERVEGQEQFARLVRETPAGRAVELGIVRDGRRSAVSVEIGRRETRIATRRVLEATEDGLERMKREFGDFGGLTFRLEGGVPRVRIASRNRWLGVELEDLEGQLAAYFGVERGVLVTHVREGSPADEAGLRAGDVIVGVDGRAARRAGDIGRLLEDETGEAVSLEIVRDRTKTELQVPGRPSSPRARSGGPAQLARAVASVVLPHGPESVRAAQANLDLSLRALQQEPLQLEGSGRRPRFVVEAVETRGKHRLG